MSPLPVITGIGLVTPLGGTADETWSALVAGRFIATHARAKLTTPSCSERLTHLAQTAATEALTQSNWRRQGGDPSQAALLVGTSKGPIERWLGAHAALLAGGFASLGGEDAALSACLGLADLGTDLAARLGMENSVRLTLSAACSSGLHALARAALLLGSRQVGRVLVVAAESSLHPLFVASFNRLGVLAKADIGCRPFDTTRDGFLLSEAAAAVCLEFPSHDSARPIVALENTAVFADASHLTAADPTGRPLRHLIRSATRDLPVDLVHAHATGTVANDPLELAAVEQTVGSASNPPSVYSHKGALGHSLGAAGLVSVVLNCLAHRHGVIPGNVRTLSPLPTDHLLLSPTKIDRRVVRSLALASGFGGPLAAATLRSVEP